jgi:hypothetical protein
VFCRNVLIYFGHDDVVAFLDRLKAWLPPTAHLFVGYSESLWQVTHRFQLVRLGDAFAYRPVTNAPEPEPRWQPERPRQRSAPSPLPPPLPLLEQRRRPRPASPEPGIDGGRTRTRSSPSSDEPPRQGVVELMADGEAALGRGEHADAVTAFRKAAYIDPDHPIAHLNLGLALEVAGDGPASRRAYAAARAAIDRCDTAAVEATLEGYHLDGLTRLLEQKLRAP